MKTLNAVKVPQPLGNYAFASCPEGISPFVIREKRDKAFEQITQKQETMNMTTLNRYSNQFEPFTYADLATRSFSAVCGAKLEQLKNNLVRRFAAEFSDLQDHLIRRAVEEAEALASLT